MNVPVAENGPVKLTLRLLRKKDQERVTIRQKSVCVRSTERGTSRVPTPFPDNGQDAEQNVEPEAVTGEVVDLPEAQGASTECNVRLSFYEAFESDFSYRTLRDDDQQRNVFSVANGAVTQPKRNPPEQTAVVDGGISSRGVVKYFGIPPSTAIKWIHA